MYSYVDTGVRRERSLLPSRDRWCGTVDFFRLYGAQTRFLIPGDVWKEDVNVFIRCNPMLTPSLTPMRAKTRHFFVPLRMVEPDLAELVITGSNDGKLSDEVLPEFDSIVHNCLFEDEGMNLEYVAQDSIAHVIFEIPFGFMSVDRKNDKALPRLYWLKAYCRLWWDWYRDENLAFTIKSTRPSDPSYNVDSGDFEDFFVYVSKYFTRIRCLPICLPKDYFTSSLPWQLKGIAPTISFTVSDGLRWNGLIGDNLALQNAATVGFYDSNQGSAQEIMLTAPSRSETTIKNIDNSVQKFLSNVSFSAESAFNASDMRDMFALTRVFERLARTGSRYVEYLRANFGIAPDDGTLQRAQYLGGFSQDVLTTEVLQNGPGDTPVGTMRGHGISNSSSHMTPYVCKEFGMLFTTFEIEPRIQYARGIKRELTYASRYDFFNPSFQRLSEQEVRKGEISFNIDEKLSSSSNDDTFGFQGIYNELRSGKERFFGSMLNDQAQWNQAIHVTPLMVASGINGALIDGTNYAKDFLRPFGLSGESETAKPIIVDLYCVNTPYRPMIKESSPGHSDHN